MKWTACVFVLCLGGEPAARQTPAPPAPTGTAQIAGRVVAADSGLPIVSATLQLLPVAGGVPKRAGADAQGRFAFTNLPAGSYRLTATAEGYVGLDYGQRQPPEPGKPIDLKNAESFSQADLSLPRASAIEGQLVDEFGDPASGVTVQIARIDYVAGRTRLMPIGSRYPIQPTDDKGQFRVFGLAPGDYFVLALSGPFAGNPLGGPGGPTGAANDRAGFAPTFYPGTAAAPDAKPVHLAMGQDATNINFALTPARAATLSGKTLDPSGQPAPNTQLMLLQLYSGDVRAIIPARAVTGADGSFSFRNVPWGSYVIQGSAPTGFGTLLVTADQPRLPDLSLTIRPLTAARGRVVLDGDAPPPPVNRLRVQPRPTDFVSGPVGGGPAPYKVNDDLTFEVSRQAGFRVMHIEAPAPWMMKSVMLNGQDVTDTPLDFRIHDVEGLEVTLTSRISSVSGSVADATGKPVTDYTVIAFAEDSRRWTFPSRFILPGRSNQQGTFRVAGLPPENYLAIALSAIQGTEWQDPTFLEKLRSRATRFVLGEGENKTLDLKIVRP